MAAVSATAPPFSAEADVGPVGVAPEQAAAKTQKPTSRYRMCLALSRVSLWEGPAHKECSGREVFASVTPLGAKEGRKRSCDKFEPQLESSEREPVSLVVGGRLSSPP